MADDIPAGWYPDIHGTIRWWDGARWTDHVRDTAASSTAPPGPADEVVTTEPARPTEPIQAHESTAISEPVTAAPATAESTGTEAAGAHGPPSHVASPVGIDRGEAARAGVEESVRNPLERYASETAVLGTQSTQPTPSADTGLSGGATVVHRPARTISYPKTVEEEIEEDDGGNRRIWLIATMVGLAALFLGMGIGQRTSIDPPGTSDPIPPAVNTESSDIDQLRQQLEDRQAELDERQQILDQREEELDRRASAPPSPSPTPTTSPTATATETEIDGNDRVLVGTDVREGTYRTTGPVDPLYECEYTVSEDEFGDDPITEESTKTAASVTLRDGDWFETDDCQDWERE